MLGGDITHFGGQAEARSILDPLRARCRVLAVAGNCDRPEVARYLEEEDLHLEGHPRCLEGIWLVGIGAGLPFGDCPFERDEDEYAALCHSLPLHDGMLLVSHQPPWGKVCDRTRSGNVGSRSIRAWVERARPQLLLCGHIHEGKGEERIGPTRVVNPGPCFSGGEFRFQLQGGAITLG